MAWQSPAIRLARLHPAVTWPQGMGAILAAMDALPPTFLSTVQLTRESHTIRRAGLLTPYTAETIAEDALRAGPDGSVTVTVSRGTRRDVLEALRRRLAPLSRRGLLVHVRPGPVDHDNS